MSAIAQLIIEQGRQAAEARAARGQIWGRAVENISAIPGDVMAQQREAERLKMEQQDAAAKRALEGQKFQMNTGTLADQATTRAEKTKLDALSADPTIFDETGNLNKPALLAKARSAGLGLTGIAHVTGLVDQLQTSQDAIAKREQELDLSRRDALGDSARYLLDHPESGREGFHLLAVTHAGKALDKTTANQYLDMTDPAQITSILKGMVANSPKATAEERAAHKPVVVAPDASLVDPAAAAAAAQGATTPGGAVLPTGVVFQGQPKPKTAAELDADAQALYAKKAGGQALSPVEQAALTAYEERKRVVSDPALIAATERQTAGITATAANQKRAQDFAELQAARADLEKNVTTPYLTARASANTMRDVVAAAQAGNKVAGSLQSLETTMAAIRAQGLNRINTAEIGVTANAGSMWDRLVGWMGKAESGQPVPTNIQKDMLAFADILEKAAYRKYEAGHEATSKTYGKRFEKLPPPVSGSSSDARLRAHDVLKAAGKQTDEPAVDLFLKNNPTF